MPSARLCGVEESEDGVTKHRYSPNYRPPPPAVLLVEELAARGMTPMKLARQIDGMSRFDSGVPEGVLATDLFGVILRNQRISPELAAELHRLLGPSAELWTNLDRAYREWKK